MTQEDKELLLKDLCTRLPYGVKVCCNKKVYNIDAYTKSAFMLAEPLKPDVCIVAHIEEINPYLFPMSSMTEEQKREYDRIIYHSIELHYREYSDIVEIDLFDILQDFYCKNHFDYRGLIEKGLAIDATNKNIY